MRSAMQRAAAGVGSLAVESLWTTYRSPSAQKLGRAIFPEHTRDAFFQLVCGLRCNAPKDAKFWRKHLSALQPRTLTGWLALFTGGLYAGAGLAMVSCTASATVVALLWASMFAVVSIGLSLASVFSVLSFFLLLGAVGLGFTAFGFASGYCFSAVTQRVVTLAWNVGHLLVTLSSSSPQSDQRWHADRSAPVEGVPITNGRSGKSTTAKAKPQRRTPALPHELVVDEALRLLQDEKQNNTQLNSIASLPTAQVSSNAPPAAQTTTPPRHPQPLNPALSPKKPPAATPKQSRWSFANPKAAQPPANVDMVSMLETGFFRGKS